MYKKVLKPAYKKVGKPIYKAAKKYVPKGTAARVGGTLGASAGSMLGNAAVGAQIGKAMGKQFAKITGVGEYSMSNSNSIMNPRTTMQPRVEYADEDIIISRCEYVTDLVSGATGSPTSFDLNTFYLNPGLDSASGGIFSWLPQVAQGFSQYKFEQCVVHYKSASGDSTGANTALGNVFLCANYQATAPSYTNKLDILNSQYAVSGPPSNDLLFPIECKRSAQNLKFHQVRSGELLSNQNQDLFDYCSVQIGTQGIPTANQVLGEIWITYKVRLSKYKTNDKSNLVRSANYRWTGAAGQGPVSAYPLGQSDVYNSAPVRSPGSNLTLTIAASTLAAQSITFPEYLSDGTFLVALIWRSAALSAITWNMQGTLTFTNCVATNVLFSPNSAAGQSSTVNNQQITTPTTLRFSYVQIIQITGPSAKITVSGAGTLDTDCTDFQILVTEVNPAAFLAGA